MANPAQGPHRLLPTSSANPLYAPGSTETRVTQTPNATVIQQTTTVVIPKLMPPPGYHAPVPPAIRRDMSGVYVGPQPHVPKPTALPRVNGGVVGVNVTYTVPTAQGEKVVPGQRGPGQEGPNQRHV